MSVKVNTGEQYEIASLLNVACPQVFRKVVDKRCSLDSTYALHFVECSYESKPAWSQNDAMMEGYLDERDYYFR